MTSPFTTRARGETLLPGVRINLRRRQRLDLQQAADDHLFVIESGCLTLDSLLPQNRRQVTLVLYPGDIITRRAAPPVAHIGLTATLPSSIVRVRGGDCGPIDNNNAPTALDVATATNLLAARVGLHAIAIGRLTSEERIATLLLEMAHYLGKPTPGGHSFELPLSRADMADYMALNPDTLSRLMSRLRASGLLVMQSRSRATVKDLATLEAISPLAHALRHLRRGNSITTR